MKFAFDKTYRNNNSADKKMLEYFAALPQSCILKGFTFVLLAYHESLSYFQALASHGIGKRTMADDEDIQVVSSHEEQAADNQKGKKERKRSEFGRTGKLKRPV